MPDIQEVYEMVTKHRPPEHGALERQQKRQVRAARNKKIGGFAVAAAIGLAAIVLVLVNLPGQDTTRPPATTSPSVSVNPEAEAEEVARGYLDAFGAFDVEAAMTYLADDADITGMTEGLGVEGLPRMTAFLEAQGYKQTITSCEASHLEAVTTVICSFALHAIRSDEIGRGPFEGSYFRVRIQDGEIIDASMSWWTEEYSPQMWEPFADWVSTTYPGDVRVMYNDTLSSPRLTDRSIQLWRQHTREYVRAVQAGEAQ